MRTAGQDRAHKARRLARAIAAGLCRKCCCREPEAGFLQCRVCREKSRRAAQRGCDPSLCAACGKRPPKALRTMCEQCLAWHRAYSLQHDGHAARRKYDAKMRGDARLAWRKRANAAVARAIKTGKLLRTGSCSVCGSPSRYMHHDSYATEADFLVTRELCDACHRDWHATQVAPMPPHLT